MPRRLIPAWSLCLSLAAVAACGARADGHLSPAEAERRLQEIEIEISQLQDVLAQSRQRHTDEQRSLRATELAIQEAVLTLRSTDAEVAEQEQELQRLRVEREAYLQRLEQRSAALARQILSAYRLGRESRLKLLLNQDSPARLGRMLAYYDYLSTAQAEQISELRIAIATLDRMQTGIDRALAALATARERQRAALTMLEQGRRERQALLRRLAGQIEGDEATLAELTRNREDLEALINRLVRALADIPGDLGAYRHPSQQRGSLPMPLHGRVLHAFGQTRSGGLRWQGWLIGANSGAEVQAIAYGRVAFADWLRGYGLMMILDHGDGFMSLYGNNETLLYEVGDWVQPGTVISTVGTDQGSGQGLYFELRDKGKALDPSAWLARR